MTRPYIHWSFEDLRRFYVFEPGELVQMPVTLDRLQLVELQPGNRIKLLVARNFGCLPLLLTIGGAWVAGMLAPWRLIQIR